MNSEERRKYVYYKFFKDWYEELRSNGLSKMACRRILDKLYNSLDNRKFFGSVVLSCSARESLDLLMSDERLIK